MTEKGGCDIIDINVKCLSIIRFNCQFYYSYNQVRVTPKMFINTSDKNVKRLLYKFCALLFLETLLYFTYNVACNM